MRRIDGLRRGDRSLRRLRAWNYGMRLFDCGRYVLLGCGTVFSRYVLFGRGTVVSRYVLHGCGIIFNGYVLFGGGTVFSGFWHVYSRLR